KRTLVLVNGRRHVAADILSSASSPDVNTISSDLIERVDIVTGGNSAVYGSDAIAGVVNFILKRDFDGVQVRAHGSEPAAGFGTSYFGSIMAGKNFADGRGNITLQAEYNHEKRVFGSDIPWLRQVNGFIVSDVDVFPGIADAHNSDGFPDNTFVRDIRSASISPFGVIFIQNPSTNALCGTGLGGTNGAPSSVGTPALPPSNPGANNGIPYNCNYIFNPDGSMALQTGTRVGTGPTGNFIGGNGPTTREGQQLSVFPENKRINLNLLAHYDVSDAFQPFVEAKWVKLDTSGNNAGPGFINSTGTFEFRERMRLDNPFLTAAERTTIANAILASGCNTSRGASCNVAGINASTTRTFFGQSIFGGGANAFCAANPADARCQGTGGPLNAFDQSLVTSGAYRVATGRNMIDAGLRDEHFTRDT